MSTLHLLVTGLVGFLGLLVLIFDVTTGEGKDKRVTVFGFIFLMAFSVGIIANVVTSHYSNIENSNADKRLIAELRTTIDQQSVNQSEAAILVQDRTDVLMSQIEEQRTALREQEMQLSGLQGDISNLLIENSDLFDNQNKLTTLNNSLVAQNATLFTQNDNLSLQITQLGGHLSARAEELQRVTEKRTELLKDEFDRQEQCRRASRLDLLGQGIMYRRRGCEDFANRTTDWQDYDRSGYADSSRYQPRRPRVDPYSGRVSIDLGGGISYAIED